MKFDESRARSILLAPVLIVIVGAIAVFSYWPGDENPDRKVRVAYLPIYVDLPLFVAVEEGFLNDRDLEVELIRFESSPLMGTALVSNEVDAVASIASSVAFTIESRDPGRFKIFIVDAENPMGYLSALVAMPHSSVSSVEDLKGKKIGIFPGPTAGTFFRLFFEGRGLNVEADLTIVELAPGLHVDALVNGQVDALATYEPMATQAVVDHGAVKLVPGAIESEVINPWQAGSWLVSSRFVKERPQLAEKFIDACYEAIDFMRDHPDEAKKHLKNYTGIRAEVASETPTIPFTKVDEVDIETFQRHADILQDAGVLSKKIDVRSLLMEPMQSVK